MEEAFKKFTAPLSPTQVEWKVQSKTKTGKTVMVPYMDARAVYDRLDLSFGPHNWKSEIREAKEGMICRITIKTPEGETYREDGSEPSNYEAFKGAISGAIKRAAHQFGIGRELYSYPKVFVHGDVKFIDKELLGQLHNITTAFLNGTTKDVYVIKPGEVVGEPF